MRISEILSSDKVGISCELFPPKRGSQLENAKEVVREMAGLSPSYMSVTYGATGGTSEYTVDLADEIKNGCHIPALAHLTCASSTKEKVRSVIAQLKEKGIENILALRGDIPAEADFPLPNQYRYASELIYDIKSQGDFCIGGACYPEGHPEAATMEEDLDHLKEKVEAGCDFLTTQMFFDNNIFYNFLCRVREAGIDVPVIPGIMPITRPSQLQNAVKLSGCNVPMRFRSIVDCFGRNPEAMQQAGIIYATDQIIDLIANGIKHIHVYSMNKPEVVRGIQESLSRII